MQLDGLQETLAQAGIEASIITGTGNQVYGAMRGHVGRALAVLALLSGFPALALYNASLAVLCRVMQAVNSLCI